MIVKFNNEYLEKLFSGEHLKGKPKYNDAVVVKFKKTVLILKNVESSIELRKFRGLNFGPLKDSKKGLFSVRVADSYRLEFKLEDDAIYLSEIAIIKDMSNHYE